MVKVPKCFRVLTLIIAAATLAACSKFRTSKAAPDPTAFFKMQGAFCTFEKAGKVKENSIERMSEIWVFGQDNSLRVLEFDLDTELRLQFNSKGQPKLKELEKATFRLSGEKMIFKQDGASREREAVIKYVNRNVDGQNLACFEAIAMPEPTSTVYCPCALPEKDT